MTELALDKEGYLCELDAWSKPVALELAERESIALEDPHWEVIEALRSFYATTENAPAMRAFVKLIKTELGAHKGTSIYLMQLFGGSPAKTAAKIAGLPRPTDCL